MNEITNTRNNHLIDPTLSIWGWEISVYLFLGGLVAGMMIIAGYFLYKEKHKEFKASSTIVPLLGICLLYTSPSPRDRTRSRMPSSA